jgi:hypothetical protein
MTLAIDDVTATTSAGILRVDLLSASAGVAAFEGDVVISAPGQQQITLDPLFDASVTAGEIHSPKPYPVDVDDDWDRLHLAEVVELDEQLERYSAAISGQLGRIRVGESYFRSVEGKGAARSMSRYVTSRAYSAPDLLIGFSIAELHPSEPARSLARAFNLRRVGGQWGVIATIMGVGSGQLVAGLEDLIFTAGALASAPQETSGPSSGPGPVSEGGPGRAGDGTAGSIGGGSGDGGGDGDAEPGDTGGSGGSDDGGAESPPPEEDCENLIDCVIGILPLDTGLLP